MTTEQAIEILPHAFDKVYRNNLRWFLNNVHWLSQEEIQDFLDQITEVKLIIDPVDPEEPVSVHSFDSTKGGPIKAVSYDYIGPGHLVLIFYIKNYDGSTEDFFEQLYESHKIQDWIHNTFIKYFGLDLFLDFADIVFAVKDSDTEEYIMEFVIEGNETNFHVIKSSGTKSWKVREQYF